MKRFEFSNYFPYIWYEVMKKMYHTSPSAFDYFACRPHGLGLSVAVSFYIYLEWFFFVIYS